MAAVIAAALHIGGVARAEDAGAEIVVRAAETSSPKDQAGGELLAKLRIPMPDRRLFEPQVSRAAKANGLPPAFLDRILWRESHYFLLARSPAGAEGIAQFMVATASDRGLSDPYDPRVAIPAAAAYLRELKTTFGGSLGLAAAAYNAGPRAVREWLVGRRPLPRETVAYVSAVTGEDLAPRGPPSAVGAFAIGAPTRPDTRELAPEAALCVRLSTSERPCRVQKTY